MAQEVKLVPIQKGQGPSPWRVTHDGKTGDHPGNYPAVKLDTDSGQQFIKFQLSGNHQGITFKEDYPIWVKAGGKPAPQETHPQIPYWTTAAQGKELIILDLNDNPPTPPLKLHYVLNFNGHEPLDPIIDNGGTTRPPPPPPPPPPPTDGPVTSSAPPPPTGLGPFGGFDPVTLLIGLAVGLAMAITWFKWGPGSR